MSTSTSAAGIRTDVESHRGVDLTFTVDLTGYVTANISAWTVKLWAARTWGGATKFELTGTVDNAAKTATFTVPAASSALLASGHNVYVAYRSDTGNVTELAYGNWEILPSEDLTWDSASSISVPPTASRARGNPSTC
jgi:hypothetical protein